jgi:DNA-binding PadR family transcriptional regulator
MDCRAVHNKAVKADQAAPRVLDNYSCYRYICGRNMAALTPAVVHVLLALAGGERHGYAILKDVQQQSGSRLRFGPGTIYGTLQRLMEAGWVEEVPAPTPAADERRRYYRLTRSGREALRDEVDRLGALIAVARAHRIQPRSGRG